MIKLNYFGLVQGKKVKHPLADGRCIFFNEGEVQKKQVYGSFIIEFGINSSNIVENLKNNEINIKKY